MRLGLQMAMLEWMATACSECSAPSVKVMMPPQSPPEQARCHHCTCSITATCPMWYFMPRTVVNE